MACAIAWQLRNEATPNLQPDKIIQVKKNRIERRNEFV
jgi:hypothetical protein